ncbi:hypothetical protein C4577_05270 [Candidatus Parcubacteria bacterium]|nr:MAG: hypothetical protein C4577_05270 [Candidatus Parcubacteria bacterium]
MGNIILNIDASETKKVKVIISENKKVLVVKQSQDSKAESTLSLIKEALNQINIKIEDIDKIYVNQGPGSFTGLRIGLSIANTVSFLLLKKVNDEELGSIVEPIYQM